MACSNKDILNVSITPLAQETVMDPSTVYFLNEYYLIENLSLRLVEMDAKEGYKLMLASSINIDISKKIYRISIKETYFSNGDRVLIEDVKKSFTRAMGNNNSHINLKEIVKSISIDGEELRLELLKPTNDFFYFLTLIDLSILHKTQYEKPELRAKDWTTATSGPFSYLIEKNGDTYLLKNPHFKLTSITYPDKIKLLSARGRNSYQDYKEGLVDIGEFNLNSYDKHINELHEDKNLSVIGNTGDMVNFLALNANSDRFKTEYNRRWILKKITENLVIPTKYDQVARKAFEFFTPQVKGFLGEEEILKEIRTWDNINTKVIPNELKQGITISTYERAYEVTLEGILDQLESILNIPVKIETNIKSINFESFIKSNKFDIFLGITSMDQVIVGESINLYYFSSFPMFKDVNGEIRKLMDEYRHSSKPTISTIKKIALQMIKDAECVPLFYVASPFFYNKSKVDISNLDELTYFNLWKIKLK